jgi:hypothetical protein
MTMEASFNDNLYGDSEILAQFGGCGLWASCQAAFWCYERHAKGCKPGRWLVSLAGHEAGEFGALMRRADAVVDDFGNLRRVS